MNLTIPIAHVEPMTYCCFNLVNETYPNQWFETMAMKYAKSITCVTKSNNEGGHRAHIACLPGAHRATGFRLALLNREDCFPIPPIHHRLW